MAEHSFHLVFKGFTDEASGYDFGSSRERKRGFSALLLCFHIFSSAHVNLLFRTLWRNADTDR